MAFEKTDLENISSLETRGHAIEVGVQCDEQA